MNSAKALLDIPDLPEEAFKHIGDRKIRPQGDSGGGSSAPATQTTTQTSELPEWARGYAKDTLAKGAALTDVNQNPYQTYTGDRIAGFSPMQQQAMQGAQNMTTAPQTGEATAAATMAGLGGLGVAGQANPYGFQNQVGGYMNPYMNQILAPQLAEANRNYDIGATKQQSAATQAGAFGGSREAIMAAENERNRNTGLNQIYGQGLNTAYSNAQNQYNQNLQNQLAGYGMANQAAGQLGNLGQNQYTQNMGINQLQAGYGGQQQALQQQGLTNAYQDFTNQQNYPYKQLGFMSDLIRGLPLGQQSTAAVYQAPPSAAQTIGSLGLGAYGIGQMFKAEGGSVKSMAGGGLGGAVPGGSVMSREYKEGVVDNIPTDRGLQAAAMGAQARGDLETQLAAQNEMSEDAAIRRGISGQVPTQFADNMTRHANGGIVAFALGGGTSYEDYQKKLSDFKFSGAPTPEDTIAGIGKFQTGLEKAYGPSQLDPYVEQVKADRAANKERSMDDAKGRMAFAAAEALSSGPSFRHVIGKTVGAAGREGTAATKEFKEADRLDRQAEIALVGANQARKDGMTGKAAELNTANNMLSQKAEEMRLGAVEKGLTAAAGIKSSEIAAASARDTANKPGETERMMAKADAIYRGEDSFNGQKGPAAAKAYQEAVAATNASRLGVRFTGQNKDWEHHKMVMDSLSKDKGVGLAQMEVAQLEGMEKRTPAQDAQLTQKRAFLQNRYNTELERAKKYAGSDGTAAPAAGAATGTPTLAQFIAEARKAPQNKDYTDDQLAAYYHQNYGNK
jgi:hypothetical protein